MGNALRAAVGVCLSLLLNARVVGVSLIGLSLFGMAHTEPPREISYEEERERTQRLQVLTQCYADHHGVTLRDVYFREWTLHAPCSWYSYKLLCATPDEMVDAAGWDMPHGQTVNYYSGWIRGERTDYQFQHLAAHEVCHVTGIWDEQQTDRCADRTVVMASCGE